MHTASRKDDTLRVGLVLGAGGTAGGAFISGALAAIEDLTGWQPWRATSVVGTSIGALRGARLHPPTEEAPRERPEPPLGLVQLAERLPPFLPGKRDRLLTVGRRIGGRLVALATPAGSHVADYPVGQGPYHSGLLTVSVLRRRGSRVVTTLATAHGPQRWLYASAAVPNVNAPVRINGQQHIDGAVHSTTNADLVSPANHDIIIVIAPMVRADGGPLVSAAHRAQLATELEPWRSSDRPVLVVVPTAKDAMDNHDHEALRQAGYDCVARVRLGDA